jgi:hypothetical protein
MPELGTLARQIVEFLAAWGLSAAAGAGFAVWIMRTWISEKIRSQIKSEYDEKLATLQARLKSEYDEKLETHKAQLKAQGDVEIEKLKSDLSIAAAQRQVRFSKLHERQAEIIAEVYNSLTELVRAIADYVAIYEPVGGTSREERAKKVEETAKAFSDSYRGKKIFFPEHTAVKLDEIFVEIRRAYIKFVHGVDHNPKSDGTMQWLAIFEGVQKLSETAVIELEHDFRTLLGHEDK